MIVSFINFSCYVLLNNPTELSMFLFHLVQVVYIPALYCSLWCSVNTPCKMISILICSLVERAIVHGKIHGGNPPENLWWHKFSESPKPLQRGDGTLYHKDFSFTNQSFFLLGKSLPRPWGIIVIVWHRYIL